jgi:hypothetical protein
VGDARQLRMTAPSLAAVTGLLPRSAGLLLGVRVSAQCGGSQFVRYFRNGPLGDLRIAGLLNVALAKQRSVRRRPAGCSSTVLSEEPSTF